VADGVGQLGYRDDGSSDHGILWWDTSLVRQVPSGPEAQQGGPLADD